MLISRVALIISTLLPLGSCASAPWACTPDTCLSVATADWPEGLANEWEAESGEVLRLVHATEGIDGPPVLCAGSLLAKRPDGSHWMAHVSSFDSEKAVAEVRLGPDAGSPRRFHRILLLDDQLLLAPLQMESVTGFIEGEELRIVEADDGAALEYSDNRAMAAIMEQLLDDEAAWGTEIIYDLRS